MDKYQAAIVEYEAARKQIIHLTDEIGNSMGYFDHGDYRQSCTCGHESDNPLDDTDCVHLLYKWNREYAAYREEWESCGGSLVGPFDPEMPPKPELCEAGRITDKLIQDRKAAKKRFGIAKRRLSALAKPFANPKTPDV